MNSTISTITTITNATIIPISDMGLSGGAIAGIVIGTIFGVILCCVIPCKILVATGCCELCCAICAGCCSEVFCHCCFDCCDGCECCDCCDCSNCCNCCPINRQAENDLENPAEPPPEISMQKTTWKTKVFNLNTTELCSICLTPLKGHVMEMTNCKHQFHNKCISKWKTMSKEPTPCPYCNQALY